MRKFRVFIHVLKHSLVPLDAYYRKVRKTHLSFSFKYFIALVSFVILTSIVLKSIIFVSAFPPERLKTYISETEKSFPDNLVIDINNLGRLSSNIDKPFILLSPMANNPQSLLVIDPKAHKDKIYEYNTLALMTERRMYVNYGDSILDYPYKTGERLRIDKNDIQLISRNSQLMLNSYWLFIFFTIIVGILLAIPILGSSLLFTLAIASLIYFVIFTLFIKHKRTSFKSIFQISLHAVTGPLLIQGMSFVLGLTPSIPMWHTIVIYVFLAGSLYESYFDKS